MTFGLFFSALYFDKSKEKSLKSIVMYSVGAVVLFLGIPALCIYILKKNRHRLQSKRIKNTYGSLYLGIKTESTQQVYYVIEQLVVRFLFVVVTYTLFRVPGILINVYMFLNNMHIIYLGWFRPFDSKA